ncbi:MAG: RNA polymerase sigma factor [Oceanicaulis sp.]
MRPALRLVGGSPNPAGEGAGRIAADRALARSIGRGDRKAVAALTARCLPLVHGLAARTIGDRVEAEDVAQEAFVKVWRNIGRYEPERARIETWVARIALNLCYDRLRKRGETLLDGEAPEQTDHAPRADAMLAAAGAADRVRAAVAALPLRQRTALELCHFQEMSQAEAAAVLEVSVDALESLLARGRRALKAALAGDRSSLIESLAEGRGGHG